MRSDANLVSPIAETDAISDGIDGDRDADTLLRGISSIAGDGRELEFAAQVASFRSRAYRRGFFRRVQKEIERGRQNG